MKMTKILLVAVLALTWTTGCTNIKSAKSFKWPWDKTKESPYEIPTRMVVTWSYNILTVPNQKPSSGFGARIYFYNNRSQAIPVDGHLTVYAYDDTEVVEAGSPPTAKFAFTPQQFTRHFKETDLGASYSIWIPIPWHDINDPPRSVSLIPVFTNAKGGRIVGKQSLNLLPGRAQPKEGAMPTRFIRQPDGTLVPEEVQKPTAPRLNHAAIRSKVPRIRSTTIPLSDGLIRQSRKNPQGNGLLPQQAPLLQQLRLARRDLQSVPSARPQPGQPILGTPVAQGIPVVSNGGGVQPASASGAPPKGVIAPPQPQPDQDQRNLTGRREYERFRVQGTHVQRPFVRRHRHRDRQ